MSLINGIAALGTGLAAYAGDVAKDAETRTRVPLLSSAPAATPVESTPSLEAATTPAGTRTPVSGASTGAPAEYLPFYAAASKRTGIPIDVLIAQARQESGFDPNAVGGAGEIGLHQIKPSTARQPGWGLKGIDPATLTDPAVNIAFAADYMKARAGTRIDFSDPAAVDAALRAYNSGGDPNYVANVRRHMGAA